MGILRSLVVLITGILIITFLNDKKNKWSNMPIIKNNKLYVLLLLIVFLVFIF